MSDQPFERHPVSIGLRRPYRRSLFAVDDALADMHADGFLEELVRRWLEA